MPRRNVPGRKRTQSNQGSEEHPKNYLIPLCRYQADDGVGMTLMGIGSRARHLSAAAAKRVDCGVQDAVCKVGR